MNIEKHLESIFDSNNEINPDELMGRFHRQRIKRNRHKHQLMNGMAATVIILFVGVFSVNLFNGHNTPIVIENYSETMDDAYTDEMVEEFALYLMDESEDIWETLEFLNEIGYEPVSNLMSGGS